MPISRPDNRRHDSVSAAVKLPPGTKVVIADDSRVARALIADVLNDAGCETWCVASSDELSEAIFRVEPDLTIVAEHLLGQASDAGAEAWRFPNDAPPTPTVVTLTHDSPQRVLEVVRAGFSEILFKPLDRLEILTRVLRALPVGTAVPRPAGSSFSVPETTEPAARPAPPRPAMPQLVEPATTDGQPPSVGETPRPEHPSPGNAETSNWDTAPPTGTADAQPRGEEVERRVAEVVTTLKRQIRASVSEELRQPLEAIVDFVQNLRPYHDPRNLTGALEVCRKTLAASRRLVDATERIEAGLAAAAGEPFERFARLHSGEPDAPSPHLDGDLDSTYPPSAAPESRTDIAANA